VGVKPVVVAATGRYQETGMNTVQMQQPGMIVGILVIIAIVAVAAWLFHRKRQSERLEQRFGPEYDRAVTSLGSQEKAEAELMAREQRVEKLRIVPLAPAEAQRFAAAWMELQRRFVDSPKGVLAEADLLVRELMTKRGYPMTDFERRAADISVDHADVVGNYRAAQAIAARDERGEADTEQLRQGVVHYRALFEKLLDDGSARSADRESAERVGTQKVRMQS
jgi:FtsZ-interacting cell division protein ZipA